jgi:putative SOS response-associated peptidase YedK
VTRKLTPLHWGLIPSWADDPSVASRMINARGETVATKPAYRQAFSKRRCLIVADGFYEWRKIGAGKKSGPGKQPYYIHLADGRPFAFAGLWEHWRRGELTINSCTIITTEAYELLAGFHDRMPVILPPRDYDLWLDPTVTDSASVLPLIAQYPAEEMALEPVSTRVNSPKHDAPDCLQSVDEDAPPAGFLF